MPTTTLPALDGLAQAVPLIERLRSVPPNAVLRIDTPNTLGVDTRSIPVGRLCHEAAESLEAALAVPAQQGKWLPKEPTEAMSLAGEQALMARAKPLITWAEHLTHVWVAMYDAAAPAAPGAAVPAEQTDARPFPEGWKSAAEKPPAPGWYEQRYSDGIYAHWWSGEQWSVTKDGNAHWRQLADAPYPLWRPVSAPAADQPHDVFTPPRVQ